MKEALRDANVTYDGIDQAVVGFCYGSSTSGHRRLYQMGMKGLPIYKGNTNCATGSTALLIAKQLIVGGIKECVLALGFEKMSRGAMAMPTAYLPNPLDQHLMKMTDLCGTQTSQNQRIHSAAPDL